MCNVRKLTTGASCSPDGGLPVCPLKFSWALTAGIWNCRDMELPGYGTAGIWNCPIIAVCNSLKPYGKFIQVLRIINIFFLWAKNRTKEIYSVITPIATSLLEIPCSILDIQSQCRPGRRESSIDWVFLLTCHNKNCWPVPSQPCEKSKLCYIERGARQQFSL